MRNIFALSIVVLFISTGTSVIAEENMKVNIEETPLWVIVPNSLVINDFIHTSYPSLHFGLPPNSDGLTLIFPQFSVETRYMDSQQSLAEFKNERLYNSYNSDHSEIIDLKIDNRMAFERSYKSQTIFDFSDGTAARNTMSNYELLIENGNKLYTCKMKDSDGGFKESLKLAKSLCYSITFE